MNAGSFAPAGLRRPEPQHLTNVICPTHHSRLRAESKALARQCQNPAAGGRASAAQQPAPQESRALVLGFDVHGPNFDRRTRPLILPHDFFLITSIALALEVPWGALRPRHTARRGVGCQQSCCSPLHPQEMAHLRHPSIKK